MKKDINVIILAAGSENKSSKDSLPRCMSQFVGYVSIIEKQLRVLSLYGIKRSSVNVVIGTKGVWSDKEHKNYIKSLGCKLVENPENLRNRSSQSLLLGLMKVNPRLDCLIISGDLNFDTNHLDIMLQDLSCSKTLVREALSIGEKGTLISNINGKLHEVGEDVKKLAFPWYIFCGMAYITPEYVKKYLSSPIINKKQSYIEALAHIDSENKISCIDYIKPTTEKHAYASFAKDLTGGSFASLHKRYLIRKYADEKGAKKLIDEIMWLKNLPQNLKSIFPTIVDYSLDQAKPWFDMPFYDVPNIRKNFLNGQSSTQEVFETTHSVLDFMFKNIYTNIIGDTPEHWLKDKHLDRVESRLYDTATNAPIFIEIMSAKIIQINEKKYANLPELFFRLKNTKEFLNRMSPDKMRMIHGDLHYQNILLTKSDGDYSFVLADPRGELDGSDIYYDLGKLWHSFNGMYDLIHTDQFSLSYTQDSESNISANLILGTKEIIASYNKLHRLVKESLPRYKFISDDKDWLIKTKFNEVMHFSSVIIFHLFDDGMENRGIALYLVAVRLINEFFNEFNEDLKCITDNEASMASKELKVFMSKLKKLN